MPLPEVYLFSAAPVGSSSLSQPTITGPVSEEVAPVSSTVPEDVPPLRNARAEGKFTINDHWETFLDRCK